MKTFRTVKVNGIPRTYLNVLEKHYLPIEMLNTEFFESLGMAEPLIEWVAINDVDESISHWLNCYKILGFMVHWEEMHNPDFNVEAYVEMKNNLTSTANKITLDNWVKKTNAIGFKSVKGGKSGVFFHKDIVAVVLACKAECCKEYLEKEIEKLQSEIEKKQVTE